MRQSMARALIVLSLLATTPASAQDCTPEGLAGTAGTWIRGPDFSPNVPHELLSKAKSVVEPVSKLFFEVYPHPRGCNAKWYGSYGASNYDVGLAMGYEFVSAFFRYRCNNDKKGFAPIAETDDWFYVMANYAWMLTDFLTVNGKQYWTMKRPALARDGLQYYEYCNSGSCSATGGLSVYAWMITYPGKVPYAPVTRREYLQEARQEVVAAQVKAIEGVRKTTVIRPPAVQETAKLKEVEYLKKSSPDNPRRWQRYLEDYQTDEQRLQSTIDKMTQQYQATLKIMDGLLQRLTAEELQKPAVVSVIATAFTGFEDDLKERNANMLIRWNPDYFDSKLSKAVPQFFTVLLRERREDLPAREITRLVKEKFRFDALASMLGK